MLAERICTTQGPPETPGSRQELQETHREVSPELPSWEVSDGARQLELRVEELQKQAVLSGQLRLVGGLVFEGDGGVGTVSRAATVADQGTERLQHFEEL